MSAEENKAIYRRFIEDVINNQNLDRIGEFLAPDIVEHRPGSPRGLDGAKQNTAGFWQAFPDLRTTIEDIVAEGDLVVARVRVTGTHQGTFMGLSPTGKQITLTAMDMWRLRNGKCVEHWAEADMLGLLQQIGAIPAPGQAAG